jgi:DNA-binding LytR/AlgR family response regulator
MFVDQSTETADRMLGLIEQLRHEQRRLGDRLEHVTRRYLDRILVPQDGRTIFIRASEVEWIEAAHNHVMIHTGTRSLRLRESLGALASRLDPYRFVRIHRSTVVNVDHIAELQPWFGGDSIVVLRSGKQLRVSRSHRDAWDRWLAPSTRRSRDDEWVEGE